MSYNYLTKLYNAGVAKKEALFVPKRFNAAGREQIRRLINNYKAHDPSSVNIHDIIKYAIKHFSPDFKQGVFKGLRVGNSGEWQKIGRKSQPSSSDTYVKIKDIFKMLNKDKPKGAADLFREVTHLDYDTARRLEKYTQSPYYSINNYFDALRRKLSAEKLLKEAKSEQYLNLSKIIKNKNKNKWVYRAIQGDFNSGGNHTLFDQWDPPLDYIKRKAVFVSQHPEVAAQYLRYSDDKYRSLAIIKDPVVRKFVEKTSTPDIGSSIPLSDRLLGRAHLDKSLRHSYRAGYYHNIPQNEYEAVLPFSLYKNVPIEIYDAIYNKPYYKRGFSSAFNEITPAGDIVPRFWKKTVK